MKVYYIPNFSKNSAKTSQTIVQKRYVDLLRKKYEVKVLAPNYTYGEDITDIIDCPASSSDSIDNVSCYARYLRRQKDINSSLIISHQDATAFLLYYALYNPRFCHPKILVHFIGNQDDYSAKDPGLMLAGLGYEKLGCLWNSAIARDVVSEKLGKDLPRNISPLPVDFSKLPKKASGRQDEGLFKFIYPGNSMLAFKHLEKQIDIFDKLWAKRQDFVVDYFVLENYHSKFPKEGRPWLILNESLDQECFWQEASKHDAFISTSSNESFGLSYWELSEIGLPSLMLKADWILGVCPDYPSQHIMQDKKSLIQGLDMLIDRYDMVEGVFSKRWSKARTHFNYDDAVKSYYDNIDKISKELGL